MLYTVSAVQILATIGALGELEKLGKGGRNRVGKCEPTSLGIGYIGTDQVPSHRRFARSKHWDLRWR